MEKREMPIESLERWLAQHTAFVARFTSRWAVT